MESDAILKGVSIVIDGVPMRASIEALRIMPYVPRLISEGDGCWYDDGVNREWITRDSEIIYRLDEDTPKPKIPTITEPMYDELYDHFSVCRSMGVNPVITLMDGDVYFEKDPF